MFSHSRGGKNILGGLLMANLTEIKALNVVGFLFIIGIVIASVRPWNAVVLDGVQKWIRKMICPLYCLKII